MPTVQTARALVILAASTISRFEMGTATPLADQALDAALEMYVDAASAVDFATNPIRVQVAGFASEAMPSRAHGAICGVLAAWTNLSSQRISRVADELLPIVRETVARGFEAAADTLDDNVSAELLRSYADDARNDRRVEVEAVAEVEPEAPRSKSLRR